MAVQMDSACSFAYYNRGVCFHELRDYELVTILSTLHPLFQNGNVYRKEHTETCKG